MKNVIDITQKLKEKDGAIMLDRLNELLNKAIVNGLPEDEQIEVGSLYNDFEKRNKKIQEDSLEDAMNYLMNQVAEDVRELDKGYTQNMDDTRVVIDELLNELNGGDEQ